MAALNAVDSTGVRQHVIDDVKEWRDWLENEHDHRQRFNLDFIDGGNVNRRDAEYIVQCLRLLLPLESNPQKTTVLCLSRAGICILDEAIAVFCELLQQPINANPSLALWLHHFPRQQFRPLLESLHVNTFVKELNIDGVLDDERVLWICNLLHQKTDLIALRFCDCHFRIAGILPGLRRRHAHLQTLAFDQCAIGNEDMRALLDAINDGDFPVLKDLSLNYNNLSSGGLRSLAERGPAALRLLRKLDLCGNDGLLENLAISQLFVQNMLSTDDMNLKDLRIADCGQNAANYTPIVKACENDKTKLQVLHVSCQSDNLQPILDQLIESMPKMNTLEHFMCHSLLVTGPSMLAAFQHNTSLVELTTSRSNVQTRRLVAPILNRNQCLKYADSLMALQPKTQMPIGSKSGIWYKAFAKMGEQFIIKYEVQSDFEEDEDDDDDDDDDDTGDSSDINSSSAEEHGSDEDGLRQGGEAEEQGSDEDGLRQGGDGQSDNDSSSADCGGYTGASAIFKILQKRPAILMPQLRRPAADAAAGLSGGATGKDGDWAQKDTNEERKRRRL